MNRKHIIAVSYSAYCVGHDYVDGQRYAWIVRNGTMERVAIEAYTSKLLSNWLDTRRVDKWFDALTGNGYIRCAPFMVQVTTSIDTDMPQIWPAHTDRPISGNHYEDEAAAHADGSAFMGGRPW